MKQRSAALTVLLLLATACAARAQGLDALVVPSGELRLSAGGVYSSYDSWFTPGGSAALGAALSGPLDASTFAPASALQGQLVSFFAATDAVAGPGQVAPDAETLTAGTAYVRMAESVTRVPFRLALGLLPRVEIGVGGALVKRERMLQALGVEGGTVGQNPEPSENQLVLEPYGLGDVGSSPLLPTAASPLGQELQRRVAALTGGTTLTLPESALDSTTLQGVLATRYGVPLRPVREDAVLEGVEVSARALLLSTFGSALAPPDSARRALRVAAGFSVGFPGRATEPDTVEIAEVVRPRPARLAASLVGDVYAGRSWTTIAVGAAQTGSTEVAWRTAPLATPLLTAAPGRVRLGATRTLGLSVTPRYELQEAISIGATYRLALVGSTDVEPLGEVEEPAQRALDGGAAHTLGLTLRFNTLHAWAARRAAAPVELELNLARTLTGPEGWPAASHVSVGASVYPRLWGRTRTPPPPAPAAPPAEPTPP